MKSMGFETVAFCISFDSLATCTLHTARTAGQFEQLQRVLFDAEMQS
jgi:hypothetical protein